MMYYYFPVLMVILSKLSFFSAALRVVATVFLFSFVIIFSGFRYYSDIDYSGYYELFLEVPLIFNFSKENIYGLYGETGYLLINSIVKTLGFDFYVITIVFSMLSITIKYYVANKVTKYPIQIMALYLCLYFIIVEFIELRWSVASALVILSVYYLYCRNYYKYLITIFVASLFHYYSLVFLSLLVIPILSLRMAYFIFSFCLLLSLVYRIADVSIFVDIDSNYYIIRRFLRYLNGPESSVGVFSYLKILLYLLVFLFLKIIKGGVRNINLEKVALILLSFSLFVSYVPLLYFRSMVISEFFCLMYIFHMLAYCRFNTRLFVLMLFGLLFSLWNIIDVRNNFDSEYISYYSSWLVAL